MRVVVNQMSALGRKTGVGTYTAGLLHGLRAHLAAGDLGVFPGSLARYALEGWRGLQRRLETPAPQPGTVTNEGRPGRPGWRGRVLARMRRHGQDCLRATFRAACRWHGCDLYHEPNFFPLPFDGPVVNTLHDLSVVLHPEWHPAGRVHHYERHFPAALAATTHFVCVSEFTRRQTVEMLGVPPERVSVTYNGVRAGLAPLPAATVAAGLARLGLPPRYLLYLGTLEPRKNVLRLLRVYCSLPADLRERWPLLLVGGWGWNTADLADFLHSEARHRGVRHLGYLDDADVPLVYNGARALVYPSLYEGFGLPPVEMLACGGAVLASTADAIRETVGCHGHLVDPEDDDGWRQALARVVSDDDWWRSLRHGSAVYARRFTWQECARRTIRVYRRLAEPARPSASPLRKAG